MSPQRKRIAIAAVIGLAALSSWLFLTRWTPDQATNAQHFQQALLEVRSAIAYANERGGMIDPSDTEYLIASYQRAIDHANQVEPEVLLKIHSKLDKIWIEAFLPSTNFYIRALKDQDRDLARRAGLLQDDWVRWLQLNGQNLDIPPAP